MAMQLQNGGGAGRNRMRPVAEINVTPMVDVMLVLLIIFMVTAPLLNAGVDVDLPDADAPNLTQAIEPLAITIKEDGTIFVQETEIDMENLVPHLQAIAEAGYEQSIFIRGDKNTPYDNVAKVLGRINSAGYQKTSLVMD